MFLICTKLEKLLFLIAFGGGGGYSTERIRGTCGNLVNAQVLVCSKRIHTQVDRPVFRLNQGLTSLMREVEERSPVTQLVQHSSTGGKVGIGDLQASANILFPPEGPSVHFLGDKESASFA